MWPMGNNLKPRLYGQRHMHLMLPTLTETRTISRKREPQSCTNTAARRAANLPNQKVGHLTMCPRISGVIIFAAWIFSRKNRMEVARLLLAPLLSSLPGAPPLHRVNRLKTARPRPRGCGICWRLRVNDQAWAIFPDQANNWLSKSESEQRHERPQNRAAPLRPHSVVSRGAERIF